MSIEANVRGAGNVAAAMRGAAAAGKLRGAQTITISGLHVAVDRKRIKNLHLGVYPPDGRVRVAAPLAVSDAAVRVAVIGKLPWIKRQQAAFTQQARESEREFVSGETHHYLGRAYRLEVVVVDDEVSPGGRGHIVIRGNKTMLMVVPSGTSVEARGELLTAWYRARLRAMVPKLLAKWEPQLRVKAVHWGIRRMKTKWGSCNPVARRVWLNAELIKKPVVAIEYVLVHELAHLRVRTHDAAFTGLLDTVLPGWRRRRAELNAAPLAAEVWPAGRVK